MNNYKPTGIFNLGMSDNSCKRMAVFFILVLHIAFFTGCSNGKAAERRSIDWVKVFNTGEEVDFCQIDKNFSAPDQFLISYSCFPATGGDLYVQKIKTGKELPAAESLYKSSRSALFALSRQQDSVIGFVQCAFEQNRLKTSLFLSFDKGNSWVEKKTPLTDLLKLYITENSLFVQGNLERAGQLFRSTDFGEHWQEVTTAGNNYQNLTLTHGSAPDGNIFCIGSDDTDRDNRLLLFDVQANAFRELLRVNNAGDYIKPIGRNDNIHAIVSGNWMNLYSYTGKDLQRTGKFCLPAEAATVHNLFIDDSMYILTAENEAGKTVSWISFENGNQWEKYNQDKEYKLVFCADGDLFMADAAFNILKGSIVPANDQ